MRTFVLGERLPVRLGSPAVIAGAFALPAALIVVRLLPAHGLGLGLRLGTAAACVLLLPGALVTRAVGWPRELGIALSSALNWSLALIFVALAVTFGVGGSLTVTLGLLAVFTLAALLPAAVAPPVEVRLRSLASFGVVACTGLLLGVVVWASSGPVAGDGLFHLARVRKLVELDHLSSLTTLDEFRDGGLHPGYAFPLWHGAVALVSRLAGVDPALTARFLSAVLVPLSLVLVFAAARALFGSSWLAGAAVLAQAGLIGFGPGHGGGYTSLVQPGSASRQLILPAILALTFEFVHDRDRRLLPAIAAGGLALALTHPTYALYLALVLGGFLLARALLAATDIATIGAALTAVVVPAAAVAFWLLPIVRQTASHEPSPTQLARDVKHYGGQLDISSATSFRLAPEIVGRSGAVAVAALLLIPFAALAPRRRWAAFVLGSALTVLALILVPQLFTRLTDAVSLAQARRLVAFLPFAVAFAGGIAVLARFLGAFVLPGALVAGVVLQWAYPGDFGAHLEIGGPAAATWIAAFGGAAALALAMALGASFEFQRDGPIVAAAAALFVLPVAVNGLREWGPRTTWTGLTPGLVQALRADVPAGDVVLSDVATSYRIAAFAPVYVASAPPAHVADTTENQPYRRRADTLRFLRTGNLAIARRFGAGWIVVDTRRFDLSLPLPRAYADSRFVLYRL